MIDKKNIKKILIFLSLIGILILILIGNLSKEFQTVTIKKIEISETKTTIYLENNNIQLIIFDKISNLEEGDKIKFSGKSEIYKGEEQIIVDNIEHIKK
jgi:DNA/RNA endonuclease YhcR with UshA esterase domain